MVLRGSETWSRFPDVVVLLPGISGSALAKDGQRDLGPLNWSVVGCGEHSSASRYASSSLSDDDPSVDDLGDGITATRLIPDLHIIPGLWKIDGYSATKASLLQRAGLEENRNYFDFPYDWRRDNRVSAGASREAARRWLKAWRTSSGNDRGQARPDRPFHGRHRCPLFPGDARGLARYALIDHVRHAL